MEPMETDYGLDHDSFQYNHVVGHDVTPELWFGGRLHEARPAAERNISMQYLADEFKSLKASQLETEKKMFAALERMVAMQKGTSGTFSTSLIFILIPVR